MEVMRTSWSAGQNVHERKIEGCFFRNGKSPALKRNRSALNAE
jgi:hypothetical protein